MKNLVLLVAFYASSAFAVDLINVPEKQTSAAIPLRAEPTLPGYSTPMASLSSAHTMSQTDFDHIEQRLNHAINANQTETIQNLLEAYRTFPQHDPTLVLFAQAKIARNQQHYSQAIQLYQRILAENPTLNPVRIELAITLFHDQQNQAAKAQFEQALLAPELPPDIAQLLNMYLTAVAQREKWQIAFGVNYTQDNNVNNVAKDRYIENTPLQKGESMLPQKAHGIAYFFNIERDFNLAHHHYVHFENNLYGKYYWDNHDYDEITNRTYLGYANKSANQRWAILPFYEHQWYGNHRYKWAQGIRGEYNRWFTPKWQFSTALEYSKQRYHQYRYLNGHNKLISATLLWRATPRSYFYGGIDFSQERTTLRHYDYNLTAIRLGWGQDWQYLGLSSRLNVRLAYRQYLDNLRLGEAVIFDRKRQDHIYQINATLWKRDWHLWGITPKLNFTWRKQNSNFDSLYSYSEKNIQLIFEKTF
ncbi:surface lipoprotein assembly modifier [Conservatibacter flavescens]|uniref:DUF560 domain-containing protein n=1 Tax=Conservatibacter flavescens TaxID=28161 RepID=A0A2M8S2J4_9PAST|nr:surface lipoprotein assembly modifier [Conservatibacter flavescens]PJG85346.1 hypothetical protein CVP05_06370 [Conservatibacter flavescens]